MLISTTVLLKYTDHANCTPFIILRTIVLLQCVQNYSGIISENLLIYPWFSVKHLILT